MVCVHYIRSTSVGRRSPTLGPPPPDAPAAVHPQDQSAQKRPSGDRCLSTSPYLRTQNVLFSGLGVTGCQSNFAFAASLYFYLFFPKRVQNPSQVCAPKTTSLAPQKLPASQTRAISGVFQVQEGQGAEEKAITRALRCAAMISAHLTHFRPNCRPNPGFSCTTSPTRFHPP